MDARTFIRSVGERLLCDEPRAEAVMLAVFQVLRDRLTPQESADVLAQLPHGLRSLWSDNDRPGRAVERIHRDEFVGRVRAFAGLPDEAEAERGVRAVFAVLQHALGSPTGTEGEAWDVYSQLPKDLKQLWLEASRPRSE